MLGGLHRNGMSGDQEIELIYPNEEAELDANGRPIEKDNIDPNSEKKKRKRVLKFNDGDGEKTIEKAENLNLMKFDTELMIDPLFKQTTMKFDEMSLGALMTSRLSISSEILLQFDSQMPHTLLDGIQDIYSQSRQPFELMATLQTSFQQNLDPKSIEEDKTQYLSSQLDSYVSAQNKFVLSLMNGTDPYNDH